jgi:ribose 5-phosphate isomerase B
MERAMKIAIGADHRGYAYKEFIKKNLSINTYNIELIDVGAYSDERSDYPIFAQAVARNIQEYVADQGILICGTGIGMVIAANRLRGVYAGIAWNKEVAAIIKEHDNVNILVLPSDFVKLEDSMEIVHAWQQAQFKGGRYQHRIDLIDKFET